MACQIMVDDDRMELQEGEVIEEKSVRFRTLGCYPLTGAVESEANTLIGIIEEMLVATFSERIKVERLTMISRAQWSWKAPRLFLRI